MAVNSESWRFTTSGMDEVQLEAHHAYSCMWFGFYSHCLMSEVCKGDSAEDVHYPITVSRTVCCSGGMENWRLGKKRVMTQGCRGEV